MEGQLVTVSTQVFERPRGRRLARPRWAVAATFLTLPGAEPRCVDYRVRVVPLGGDTSDLVALHRTIGAMETSMIDPAAAEELGEIPAEGIPRYVFERASQSRLLAQARELTARAPQRFEASAVAALKRVPVTRSGGVRVGRPPSRSLGEKLAILRDVEIAYRDGVSRADVAKAHQMSESSLRDLLTWARHVAEPQLFTAGKPGMRLGSLTPEARRMLEEG